MHSALYKKTVKKHLNEILDQKNKHIILERRIKKALRSPRPVKQDKGGNMNELPEVVGVTEQRRNQDEEPLDHEVIEWLASLKSPSMSEEEYMQKVEMFHLLMNNTLLKLSNSSITPAQAKKNWAIFLTSFNQRYEQILDPKVNDFVVEQEDVLRPPPPPGLKRPASAKPGVVKRHDTMPWEPHYMTRMLMNGYQLDYLINGEAVPDRSNAELKRLIRAQRRKLQDHGMEFCETRKWFAQFEELPSIDQLLLDYHGAKEDCATRLWPPIEEDRWTSEWTTNGRPFFYQESLILDLTEEDAYEYEYLTPYEEEVCYEITRRLLKEVVQFMQIMRETRVQQMYKPCTRFITELPDEPSKDSQESQSQEDDMSQSQENGDPKYQVIGTPRFYKIEPTMLATCPTQSNKPEVTYIRPSLLDSLEKSIREAAWGEKVDLLDTTPIDMRFNPTTNPDRHKGFRKVSKFSSFFETLEAGKKQQQHSRTFRFTRDEVPVRYQHALHHTEDMPPWFMSRP